MAKNSLKKIEDFAGLGKADIHIHTNHSDAKPTVQEVLDYVEDHTDLDVIAIADHDTMDGYFEAKTLMVTGNYRFEIIPAEEVTSLQGHILAIYLNEPIRTGMDIKDVIYEIHRQGGLAIACHPFERTDWNNKDLPMMNGVGLITLLHYGDQFDGVEVINATPTLGDENYSAAVINQLMLQAEMGDSDAHIVEAIGKGFTLFEGSTAKDLQKAIIQHQTRAMHDKWTILALTKYAYFFMPHALRIIWNTILHGRTRKLEE